MMLNFFCVMYNKQYIFEATHIESSKVMSNRMLFVPIKTCFLPGLLLYNQITKKIRGWTGFILIA